MFGIAKHYIAVCGLNAHAGENGKVDCEEIDQLLPAIKEVQEKWVNVDRPISVDTV